MGLRAMVRRFASDFFSGGAGTGGFTMGNVKRTTSGETVTPDGALVLSTYFACVRNLSEDVAKLPIGIFKQVGESRLLLPLHPIERLLDSIPNPEQSSFTLRETLTQWLLSWGNCFAEIVRSNAGAVAQLWPIHPSRVRLRRLPDGSLIYQVMCDMDPASVRPQQKYVELKPADMFHVRGLGSGLLGYSVAALAAESIGASLAAERFGAAFFGQGATQSGILTHPGTLDEPAQKNLRESWQKTYGGARNSHKIAVLEEGVTYTPISIPPDEAQFLETRQFQVEEICRWFRMPPHKVQQLLRSTFSNIEHQSIEYVTDTLMPWLCRWEKEVKRQLITEPDVYMRHDVKELMRGDAATRSTYLKTLVYMGAISINEARMAEGFNPIDEDWANEHYMQVSMSTVKRIASGEAAAKPGAPIGSPDDKTPKEEEQL